MFALLLNHSPAFLTGELFLGLSLGLFGVAFVNTTRERYAVKVPLSEPKDPSVL
jgi:hypothetical protein